MSYLDDQDHEFSVLDQAQDAVVAYPVAPKRRIPELLSDVSRILRLMHPLIHKAHQGSRNLSIELRELLPCPVRPLDDVAHAPKRSITCSIEAVAPPEE